MKVRLYRGPMNGKCYEVPDNRGVLMTAYMPDSYAAYAREDHYPTAAVQTSHVEYRMKMVPFEGRMIPSVDPKGYVCFEWTQKRGTRIRR